MIISKIINFFSTKSVKDKIINGTLSEQRLFIYFYLIFIIDAIGFTQQCLSVAGKKLTSVDLVNIWGYLIITVLGLIILYFANGGSKGQNFLSKYFPFSFTVGYKYGIAFIILGVLPNYLPLLSFPVYEIFVFICTNLLMVANIALRIYSVRSV